MTSPNAALNADPAKSPKRLRPSDPNWTINKKAAARPGSVACEIASLIRAFLRRYKKVPDIPVAIPNKVAPSVTRVALYPNVKLRADHNI